MSNPFADLAEFEALRSAALSGDEAYERYRRRQATAARRHAARIVDLRLSERVMRMIEVAIASSRAVLLVGPPGTGKTDILEQVIDKIDREPLRFDFSGQSFEADWVTPEEEWSFEKLVLGETVVDGELASVEGELLQAIRHNHWLVLDETNRADMDRVLGGVLTWLTGKRVLVGKWKEPGKLGAEDRPVYLDWIDQASSKRQIVENPPSIEYLAGTEWRLLGTYNAVDAQRVFRMGQALSRRFKHVPVPPASPTDFRSIIGGHITNEKLADWLANQVTKLYSAHYHVVEAQLGPGLFVDIPAYVEKGLHVAAFDSTKAKDYAAVQKDSTDHTGNEGSSSEGGQEPVIETVVADRDDEADHYTHSGADEVTESIGGYNRTLVENLLAEAYMVSVGYFIAKYEPDVLEDLARSLENRQALTAKNWEWVQESLQSMRA